MKKYARIMIWFYSNNLGIICMYVDGDFEKEENEKKLGLLAVG